jgi:hypothetical protein
MTVSPLKSVSVDDPTLEAVDDAVIQEITAWVGQLVRTVKTSRLYDEANPTVVRFREDLMSSLTALLDRRGVLRLEVTSSTLSYSGREVHAARSRDDNLAGILHRDGIRVLTIEPGIGAREVESLLEQILYVTGPAAGDDDLVTLLWDADLPHVIIETVPIEGEADGASEDDADTAPSVAWPKQERGTAPLSVGDGASASDVPRSDDWTPTEHPADLEEAFDELESKALFEIARFQEGYDAGLGEPVATGATRILRDCLASDLTAADREELVEFIPRVLREALALGDWITATESLRQIRTCDPQWSVEEFSRNLSGPQAITTRKVIAALDRQDQKGMESFLAMSRQFGAPLAEWLMYVLAGSEQARVRRPLARTIAELVADHPERIVPWLADERWYVVRNVVHILGWIGGDGIASHLRASSGHPEARVRYEVVAGLSQISPAAARPILVEMVKEVDPQLFGMIVHQLGMDDHPSIAGKLTELLRADDFPGRSEEERRALFLAIATRGDAVLPALETELNHQGGLFSRRPDLDRTAIALCIARIGTPAAKAALERGARSNRGPVRKACRIAGASGDAKDD